MKKSPAPPRKLQNAHFAFMRALAQGLDERASWDRYLRIDGEHTDLRTVRKTILWIRDEFAAAARREKRPGTARLILLDPDRFVAASALPTLAEFAEAKGMVDFSEEEQLEAYEQAYPARAGRGGRGCQKAPSPSSRRGRVIARQLEALRWLQGLIVQDPRPDDSLEAWLNPSLASRLRLAGILTLTALADRINGIGARWWVQVPGVGERKAARIQDWLHANEGVLGLRVGLHALCPRRQLEPAILMAVVPAATAIRPFEKLILPSGLDGSAGRFRGPLERCVLMAANDHEAIGAWLASKGKGGASGLLLSATQRAYRKEAERLLLWAILERKTALSSVSVKDATDFQSFLENPPAAWCGPRHHQRWSPMWRPLEGPLTSSAMRQCLIILRSLFSFLMSQGYVHVNPFAAVALPRLPQLLRDSSRTLTFEQWEQINALLQEQVDTESGRRLRRGMRWIYATGLRLGEIVALKCENFEQVYCETAAGAPAAGWMLTVISEGGRGQQVPVPAELVNELGDELARHGFERQVNAIGNRGIHVMARFDSELKRPTSWSASGLYQAIKAFLVEAAEQLEGSNAQQLKKASTNWLRHSHGSKAFRGAVGQPPVPINVIQNT